MQNFVGKTKCIVGYMKVADGSARNRRGTFEYSCHFADVRDLTATTAGRKSFPLV